LEGVTLALVLVIALAIVFDYINGFHDTANAIATSVATRALHPRHAILMAATFNFVGAFAGTAVAKTIGAGLVDEATTTQTVIVAALVGAIAWNLYTGTRGCRRRARTRSSAGCSVRRSSPRVSAPSRSTASSARSSCR
jgi:phosphate/sulfate permease